jgi:Icc-related predicted phosphoesterase
VKIAALADLHGHFPHPKRLEGVDVVVIAGDICLFNPDDQSNLKAQYVEFGDWVDHLWTARRILPIGVAGNHDFAFAEIPEMPRKMKWVYLEDEGYEYKGVNFYGTPWQPWMGGWAFNAPEDQLDDPEEPFLDEKFRQIPEAADVIIAHSPPAGFHDAVGGTHKGSIALNKAIERVEPRLVVYGHIHKLGVETVGRTTLCNAAYVGYDRRPNGHPIQTFEI